MDRKCHKMRTIRLHGTRILRALPPSVSSSPHSHHQRPAYTVKRHPVIPIPHPNLTASIKSNVLEAQLLRFLLHIGRLMELHIALDLAGFEVLGGDS